MIHINRPCFISQNILFFEGFRDNTTAVPTVESMDSMSLPEALWAAIIKMFCLRFNKNKLVFIFSKRLFRARRHWNLSKRKYVYH